VTRLDVHSSLEVQLAVRLHLRSLSIACLCLGLTGCGGSSTPTPCAPTTAAATPPLATVGGPTTAPTETTSPTPTAAVTAAPTAAAASGAFTLSDSVWWSGFEIAITGGTYDVAKHSLIVNASFTNTGTQGSELRNLSDGTKVSWSGQDLPAFEPVGVVGPGATTQAQISAAVPAGFDVASAVLTFGAIDQHRALVPLDGTAATSERPTALAIAGKVTMGKYTTYTVTSSVLVPASCSGYPDRIKYGPLDATLLSIVIFGTAVNRDSTLDHHIDRGYLVLADGSKVASVPVMGIELPASTTIKNQAMCFAVDVPGSGSYKLQMHEYRSNATGTLAFTLP